MSWKKLSSVQEKTYAKVFTIALFVTTIWKQFNCPSVGEWVNKLYSRPMEYYKNIKMNETELTFQDR